jgi:hypothetical protein
MGRPQILSQRDGLNIGQKHAVWRLSLGFDAGAVDGEGEEDGVQDAEGLHDEASVAG